MTTTCPNRQAKLAAKRTALAFGVAVLSVTNPDYHPSRWKKNNRFRDTMFEELCKALIIGINADYKSWASKIQVYWNPKMRTTLGIAKYDELSIGLSPQLWNISTEEVQRALRHELAHLLAWKTRNKKEPFQNHGIEWKEACNALGIKGEKVFHDFPQIKRRKQHRKYKYICPVCKTALYRVRPIAKKLLACKACCVKHANGVYTQVYQFKLSEVLHKPNQKT